MAFTCIAKSCIANVSGPPGATCWKNLHIVWLAAETVAAVQCQPASNYMQAVRVPILKSQHFLCNLAHAVGCHRLRIKFNIFSIQSGGKVPAHLQRRSFRYRAVPVVCSFAVNGAVLNLSICEVMDFQLLQQNCWQATCFQH